MEDTLNKVTDLANKINVADIENETRPVRLSSQELLDKTKTLSLKLPELFTEINNTSELFKAENSKLEKNELDSNNFALNNQKVDDDLKEVYFLVQCFFNENKQ